VCRAAWPRGKGRELGGRRGGSGRARAPDPSCASGAFLQGLGAKGRRSSPNWETKASLKLKIY